MALIRDAVADAVDSPGSKTGWLIGFEAFGRSIPILAPAGASRKSDRRPRCSNERGHASSTGRTARHSGKCYSFSGFRMPKILLQHRSVGQPTTSLGRSCSWLPIRQACRALRGWSHLGHRVVSQFQNSRRTVAYSVRGQTPPRSEPTCQAGI